jgi:thiamine biosynthesis lipoprotein
MGTTYHIKIATEPASIDQERLQSEVEKVLAEIDQQMSTYRPDSELSRFNSAPPGEWYAVSAATAEVVAAALEISKKTDGALDVTVGPLVRLWHFGPVSDGNDRVKRKFVPPSDDSLAAARKLVGFEKLQVRLQPPALRKRIDGLEVDLSSIAPGYAIDQLTELLANRGIKNLMVEIGGEVRAAGVRGDGKAWRVAIEKPGANHALHTAVPLKNKSIATAGDYRKFFEYDGRRYSHIIDPASGRPAAHSFASVSVVAETCMEADGWDTPLWVMGPQSGYKCAKKHGVAALFIFNEKSHERVRRTPAWRAIEP